MSAHRPPSRPASLPAALAAAPPATIAQADVLVAISRLIGERMHVLLLLLERGGDWTSSTAFANLVRYLPDAERRALDARIERLRAQLVERDLYELLCGELPPEDYWLLSPRDRRAYADADVAPLDVYEAAEADDALVRTVDRALDPWRRGR